MAYHHGDLATALVEAGLEVTRTGGPSALTIREVTRRVGVSPNAAYRHFPDRLALLRAVSAAIEARMAGAMDAIGHGSGPVERLRAVGLGYIAFALAEPGWFSVCFFGDEAPAPDALAGIAPYAALSDALDLMVHAGLLRPEDRRTATWSCWSMVHGFAEMALRGPLHHLPGDAQWPLAEAAVDAAIAGITA
ncbi:Transcriptional regulator, TetR family OS=Tsukamurella paurometabola (strain ATCC 8368 / DSM/ CCUG 35730 / CIP 100753 / JCM 10117 / KCTC 9821 / NBRC 16120/ NCIMB 702349 / NCTC 13040) OX=521096 GN=Tpau_3565 PE=4 SV=1 [Tsukamurella paurometabola]|uniref:Transcriptional regulator, TetR family n=1 Tax=Tsukamurella paurometabola (strain ATCC 8368 / DSM 20162 / CCUG 35730 / CIP 100753 / JCM 10117 / KCTC 9821 / NBRC 16120 / NCIMB 702349 / NCTC 13040) TaxID=521096 RepID=D5UXC5_TSUPD|nr:TetR/AcrR family transcriptional regulator [Tsukamurella paurometabola]ADG80144.1 transcriptional regulator, TetR family [Tsukamurella paurometabola DSM 20162]SUP38579.1 Bacterial regulatory proteins, tetR family [Tsukamurella paurometabola]